MSVVAKAASFEVDLDFGADIKSMTQHLEGMQTAISKAVSRAIKKLERWLRTHSMREIGKALKIAQKPLKNRFKFSEVERGGKTVFKMWVGLLSLAAHEVGKASQNAAGVRVRGRQFDSAFISKIYDSDERVYIRASRNKQLGHATYGGRDNQRYRPKTAAFLAQYGDRFPVQAIGIDIESVARPILERYEQRLNARFREILDQELNYALNIEV